MRNLEEHTVTYTVSRRQLNDVGLLPTRRSAADRYPMGGPIMVKARSTSTLVSVDAVIDSLKTQGIAFRGPHCTPGKHVIFIIDRYILLESELLDLLEQNKLNRDGILELGKRIEARSQ